MRITVVGAGYVGLANAVLLAQENEVVLLDIVADKVALINNKIAPIVDDDISNYLATKELNLVATTNKEQAYTDSTFVVVAVPTTYDAKTNKFNTSILDEVIKDAICINPEVTIVIKSTVPPDYVDDIREELGYPNIIYSPEFLRMGNVLYDNLYPSRAVISDTCDKRGTIVVGVHRLPTKSKTDNLRSSGMANKLAYIGDVETIVYEPLIEEAILDGNLIINDLEEFKEFSDIIVTNRVTDELADVMGKVYIRDIFN